MKLTSDPKHNVLFGIRNIINIFLERKIISILCIINFLSHRSEKGHSKSEKWHKNKTVWNHQTCSYKTVHLELLHHLQWLFDIVHTWWKTAKITCFQSNHSSDFSSFASHNCGQSVRIAAVCFLEAKFAQQFDFLMYWDICSEKWFSRPICNVLRE